MREDDRLSKRPFAPLDVVVLMQVAQRSLRLQECTSGRSSLLPRQQPAPPWQPAQLALALLQRAGVWPHAQVLARLSCTFSLLLRNWLTADVNHYSLAVLAPNSPSVRHD